MQIIITILLELLWKTMPEIKKLEVAIYLPDAEAQKFLQFQQHYELFNLLLEKGVFNIRNGSISLHFDQNGVLQVIQRADVLYSKKFE